MDNNKLSETLKALRGDFSLRKVSRATNINISTLCRIEKGLTPSVESLVKLSDYFNVSIDTLLGRDFIDHIFNTDQLKFLYHTSMIKKLYREK